jgi:hypothetical protein
LGVASNDVTDVTPDEVVDAEIDSAVDPTSIKTLEHFGRRAGSPGRPFLGLDAAGRDTVAGRLRELCERAGLGEWF